MSRKWNCSSTGARDELGGPTALFQPGGIVAGTHFAVEEIPLESSAEEVEPLGDLLNLGSAVGLDIGKVRRASATS